ncbi:hypothetical protein AND_002233 [Anopheles darlingi]|uniref:Ig-like domain-containing protein n=1 Tax=Anopheles darlingi TaxID=43151 RepID=W5JTD0_ANODA|nr:hypothetical protein AND_002233 [Anopheles darlingi]
MDIDEPHTYTPPKHYFQTSSFDDIEQDNDDDAIARNPLDRGPYFDISASRNVTALVGNTAYLNCRVSWIRHRDLHLLTVGKATYTSDQRYQSVHNPQLDDWSLKSAQEVVLYPQQRDSGVYECQISTTPPVGYSMTLSVVGKYGACIHDRYITEGWSTGKERRRSQLRTTSRELIAYALPLSQRFALKNVTAGCPSRSLKQFILHFSGIHLPVGARYPEATPVTIDASNGEQPLTTIIGGPDLYIDMGSTVNLTCIVQHLPEPPPVIQWTHNGEAQMNHEAIRKLETLCCLGSDINYDSARGGVSVITEKGDITTSYLLIQRARSGDSGKYTCLPSTANPTTVHVHVLNGEHPAAIQRGRQTRSNCALLTMLFLLLMAISGGPVRPGVR